MSRTLSATWSQPGRARRRMARSRSAGSPPWQSCCGRGLRRARRAPLRGRDAVAERGSQCGGASGTARSRARQARTRHERRSEERVPVRRGQPQPPHEPEQHGRWCSYTAPSSVVAAERSSSTHARCRLTLARSRAVARVATEVASRLERNPARVHSSSDVAAGFGLGLAWLCSSERLGGDLLAGGRERGDSHGSDTAPIGSARGRPGEPTLAQLLEELGAQLDWVREYL